MPKRGFSGISAAHSAAVKRRKVRGDSRPASVATVTTLAKKVNRILSEQERKNFDVSGTLVAMVAGTPQIIQLSSIPQGDDATSRDGRKISLVSSQMRFNISGADSFRVIVMQDMQSNGVSPAVGDVLTAPTNIRSPLTLDFKERFRVIYDNFCTYAKGDYPQQATDPRPGMYFALIPEERAQVEYGGIGNIPITGAVFMYILCEDTAANISYYHRLRFTDS